MGMTQGGGLGGMVMSLFGGFRAAGGDTKAGQAYIVGEKGPELWFSGANGRVVSNADIQSALTGSRIASPVYSSNQYSGAQSPTVHNNVSTKAFIATEQVIDALRDAPGFERFVTDLVVANGRKIQGRWG